MIAKIHSISHNWTPREWWILDEFEVHKEQRRENTLTIFLNKTSEWITLSNEAINSQGSQNKINYNN